MKKHYYLIILSLIYSLNLVAQEPNINHWEVVTRPDDTELKFLLGNQAPPSNWNQKDFDDTEWLKTNGTAIGYGGVFNLLGIPDWGLGTTTTIYNRIKFDIKDTSVIEGLMLDMYFEDGFVAYLNGVEIARDNMGNKSEPTSFNQFADTAHPNNGNYFYGYFEPGYRIEKALFQSILTNNTNVLAIELHNDAIVTDAHNFVSWLLVGLNIPENQYFGVEPYLPIDVKLDSTNLPIVKITTPNGIMIDDEPKTDAHIQIINDTNSVVNLISSQVYDFEGEIGIELRGSSSLSYPKKSFGFETRDLQGEDFDVSLLGMPEESDWILYAPYSDKTFLRDVLTYKLATDLGHYAPRTRFVELVLNDDFLGVYVLTEKIKRGKNRVDVAKLRPDEIDSDSLTGGYIIKIDKTEGNYGGWYSEFGSAEREKKKNYYQYSYPKYDEIVDQQKNYIQNYFSQFELALRSDNFEDTVIGYKKYISVKSFIDYFILSELSKNMDGYRISTYMYKDRDDKGGKLHMGPVWDYNLAFGNYENFGGVETEGWAVDFGKINPSDSYQIPFWWDRLLQDKAFVDKLKARWIELRGSILSENAIFNSIDSMVTYTHEASQRNYSVWQGMFTEFIWPNTPFAENYEGEIEYLKEWITGRLNWMDDNIGEVREKVVYVSIENSKMADEFMAVGAYPNPFSNKVQITLELESTHFVTIDIYNTMGQKVTQLAADSFAKGKYEFAWDGNMRNGDSMNSGIYIYSVVVDNTKAYSGKIIKQ